MVLQDNLQTLSGFLQAMLNDVTHGTGKRPDECDPLEAFEPEPPWSCEDWVLGDASAIAMVRAIDLCLTDPQVQNSAMRAEVEAVVKGRLTEGLSAESSAQAIAQSIATTLLHGRTECEVILPLANLIIDMAPLSIGCVVLLPREHRVVRDRRSTISEAWRGVGWDRILDERLQVTGFAQVRVEALLGSEIQLAESYLEEVLNYIRCYFAAQMGADLCLFGLPGSYNSGLTLGASFAPDGAPVKLSWRKRGAIPAILYDDHIARMQQSWALEGVGKVLGMPMWRRREAGSDMYGRLASAIHWAGRATTERMPAYRAVDYGTAIDALALEENDGRKEFGKRTLWLVQQWCKGRQRRVEDVLPGPRVQSASGLGEWAERFYAMARCPVVHEGHVRLGQEWEQTLGLWPSIVLMAIAAVAENIERWPTFAAFKEAYQGQ